MMLVQCFAIAEPYKLVFVRHTSLQILAIVPLLLWFAPSLPHKSFASMAHQLRSTTLVLSFVRRLFVVCFGCFFVNEFIYGFQTARSVLA